MNDFYNNAMSVPAGEFLLDIAKQLATLAETGTDEPTALPVLIAQDSTTGKLVRITLAIALLNAEVIPADGAENDAEASSNPILQ